MDAFDNEVARGLKKFHVEMEFNDDTLISGFPLKDKQLAILIYDLEAMFWLGIKCPLDLPSIKQMTIKQLKQTKKK